jgi:hypothetical protein
VQFEIAVAARDFDLATGKSIGDCRVKLFRIADLTYGLNGGGEVGPVAAKHRCVGPDLRPARRRVAIRAEMVVKAPVPHPVAQQQQFGRIARIAAMRHHAVERSEMRCHLPPRAGSVANAGARTIARGEDVGAGERFPDPLALRLDFRIAREVA